MNAVGLDFDGTLTSIENRQVFLLEAICRSYGTSLKGWPVWMLKRNGLSNIDILNSAGFQSSLAIEIQREWISQVEENYWLSFDRVLPGVIDFLENLASKSRNLYLISARKSRRNLQNQLKQLDLTRFFNDVFCVDPSNTSLEKSEILSQLRIDIFIGDTETDALAASIASCNFIGVSSGQRSIHYLKRYGVNNIKSDVSTCLPFFKIE
jgi:phosphoglycolate phosphatase-like HAD superfamily hydrolase